MDGVGCIRLSGLVLCVIGESLDWQGGWCYGFAWEAYTLEVRALPRVSRLRQAKHLRLASRLRRGRCLLSLCR